MALTVSERAKLKDYVLQRACGEFREGQPCVRRKETAKMIGDVHVGCLEVAEMLALIDKA